MERSEISGVLREREGVGMLGEGGTSPASRIVEDQEVGPTEAPERRVNA